jgi:hypothetical protein
MAASLIRLRGALRRRSRSCACCRVSSSGRAAVARAFRKNRWSQGVDGHVSLPISAQPSASRSDDREEGPLCRSPCSRARRTPTNKACARTLFLASRAATVSPDVCPAAAARRRRPALSDFSSPCEIASVGQRKSLGENRNARSGHQEKCSYELGVSRNKRCPCFWPCQPLRVARRRMILRTPACPVTMRELRARA